MEHSIDIHLRLTCDRRMLKPGMIFAFLLLSAGDLASESVTLTTYYPAPSGVYTQMITTANTYLARDGGSVGVGTTGPLSKLSVNGGVAIGSYAGANAAPANGVIVSGSVGIGMTSPAGWAKLDVNTSGNQSIHTMDSVNGGLLIGYNGPTIQARTTVDGNNKNLSLQNWGGSVGIGPDGAGNRTANYNYLYVNNNGACLTQATNNGTCAANRYMTWVPGVYVDNSWWFSGPNMNFTQVATPLGNQPNITTTAPIYYCCLR